MKEGGAGQTQDGPNEKEEEDELIADVDVVPAAVAERLDVEDNGGHDERDKADEVGPDVAGLGVDPEDGLEAGRERRKLRPMSEVKVVVISGKSTVS